MGDEQLYGKQTALAIANFPISGRPLDRRVIRALAEVKIASARANARAGVLADDVATAIEVAARSIAQGEHADQFPVDTFQTGSGTSSNMNVNEVISTIASRASGISIHPNDHVNASQSSNDVFPTAVHLAVSRALDTELRPALEGLATVFEQKSAEYRVTVKAGRTHLMDAVPVTFGQELAGYAAQVRRSIERIESVQPRLREVPLGGTAVGTGLNAPAGYRAAVVVELAAISGVPLTPARDAFEAQSVRDALVETSGALRTLAVSLTKICNDLRWMSSGPTTGLAEIALPELQAGSSIMPGKVNPVVPEAVLQVCARVIGHDATVAWAGASGAFELTVAMPVMADALLDAVTLLARSMEVLNHSCVAGLTADVERMRSLAEASPALATALNRTLGYERGAALVKQAAAEGASVAALVRRLVAEGALPTSALDSLGPLPLAQPQA